MLPADQFEHMLARGTRKKIKVRNMPIKYRGLFNKKIKKISLLNPRRSYHKDIEKEWNVVLPFAEEDLEELK